MTNWERYFGSPEAAMRMEVRMLRDGRRFRIAVSECNPLHRVCVRIAPGAGLRLVGRVPGLAAGRIRRRNDKVGGRMSRPGCNRGCLLLIAASLLIDGLTLWAAVSLARMIIGG